MAEGELVQNVWLVPVDKIVWRGALRRFSNEEIQELAASFRVYGQLQPIMVRPLKDGSFEGVFGYQRYLAARRAGLQSVLCIVKSLSDVEVVEARLVENIHRKELTVLEKAEWIRQLVEFRKKRFGEESVVSAVADSIEAYTGERPAEQTVRKYVEIASNLEKDAKTVLTGESEFGVRHAEQLLRLNDKPELQVEIAKEFAMSPMTVQKLKQRVDEALGVEKPKETWVCDCCEQEQSAEEGKAIIKLCPKCFAEFEAWRHESGRVAEST